MFYNTVTLAALAAAILTTTATPFPQRSGSPPSTTSTTSAATGPSSASPSLIRALELASTQQQRVSLLTNNGVDPSNFIFTFVNNSVNAPTGGTVDLASVTQFPAMVGTNIDFAIGFLNPCGFNTPHSHPRANEFLTVVQGDLVAGQVLEANPAANGPGPVLNYTLGLFQGTVFLQGMSHFQFNPSCSPAVFAAGLDNVDPGRVETARALFSILDDEFIESSLGFPETLTPANIDQYRKNMPGAVATLIDSCAQRCGLSTGMNETMPAH